MNCMYQPHMNVEQEVLDNENKFNKRIKRKMQQGGIIPMFTKCEPIINQQAEFMKKINHSN